MKIYVVGFAFRNFHREVLLIKKNKPDWQKGKLNGIGGLLEGNETPTETMIREFREETGVLTRGHDWFEFAKITHNGNLIYFYKASLPSILVNSMTDEKVGWFWAACIKDHMCVKSIHWLIQLALYGDCHVTGTDCKPFDQL